MIDRPDVNPLATGQLATGQLTIGDVCADIDVPRDVVKFWEEKFPELEARRRAANRRYYACEDLEVLRGIRALLYVDGFTVRGVQRLLREGGFDEIRARGQGAPLLPRLDLAGDEPGQLAPNDSFDEGAAAPPLSAPSETKTNAGPAANPALVPTLRSVLAELEACRRLIARR